MSSIESQVRTIVAKVAQTDEQRLTADLDLIASGLVDSLRALHIVNDLERHFNVFISDDEVASYTNIGAITEGITRLKGES